MRLYKYPKWLRLFYSESVWGYTAKSERVVYLTFDDGPNPDTTDWILDCLKEYQAKATFFCIGKNVESHKNLFHKIEADGHAVGNHTMTHINGFKSTSEQYIDDVKQAGHLIDSKLFRPPYGRLTVSQFKGLKNLKFKVIFWSLLTYDFDAKAKPEQILNKIRNSVDKGDILVFHDSDKAFENLKKVLPEALRYLSSMGYSFKKIV